MGNECSVSAIYPNILKVIFNHPVKTPYNQHLLSYDSNIGLKSYGFGRSGHYFKAGSFLPKATPVLNVLRNFGFVQTLEPIGEQKYY